MSIKPLLEEVVIRSIIFPNTVEQRGSAETNVQSIPQLTTGTVHKHRSPGPYVFFRGYFWYLVYPSEGASRTLCALVNKTFPDPFKHWFSWRVFIQVPINL